MVFKQKWIKNDIPVSFFDHFCVDTQFSNKLIKWWLVLYPLPLITIAKCIQQNAISLRIKFVMVHMMFRIYFRLKFTIHVYLNVCFIQGSHPTTNIPTSVALLRVQLCHTCNICGCFLAILRV